MFKWYIYTILRGVEKWGNDKCGDYSLYVCLYVHMYLCMYAHGRQGGLQRSRVGLLAGIPTGEATIAPECVPCFLLFTALFTPHVHCTLA